ncbi:MAG TPA: class I SAM-dependent RNA methyltransferase [Anaerolineae bacterium]|nr:class I SAM-dependent RNA methyltransferase [Anaerolineae bacterium]
MITVTLTSIAHGGEAIGHHESKIVFVPYAIPGETVEAEIVEEKQRWARARLVRVLEPSPDRVLPPCPYFGPGQCSGCQWQHIAYERQLQLKAEVVADQLRRLGRIEQPPVLEPIALASETGLLDFGYRNHAQLVTNVEGRLGYVRDGVGQGQPRNDAREQGVRAPGQPAQDVIAVDECLLLHPLLDEMHGALLAGIAEADVVDVGHLDEEDETPAAQSVIIRRLNLRAGVNTGQRLLAFETVGDRAPGFVIEDLPVRCVVRRRDGSIEGLIGEPWIEEEVAGRIFRISANSFFKVNTTGAEVMVDLAAEMLAPKGHETLLDAYCGVGLFGLSLVGQVGQVIAIEESEAACEDFAWNARDLDNVTLYEGAVEDVLASLGDGLGQEIGNHPGPWLAGSEDRRGTGPINDTGLRIHMAVIDPPRSGAGPEVIQHLTRLRVPKLLYVSDDPATLARDARLLVEAGYRLEQVQPVDMFPQTYHVESLALFTR